VEALANEATQSFAPARDKRKLIYAAVLLLVIIGALVTYKATAALGVIQKVQNTGALQPRTNVLPIPGNALQINILARSANYFWVIGPALIFGILIGGAVRVLVTPRRWTRLLGSGKVRPQLVGGVAGMPLMLCSCCAAPIFSSMYERSARLGPSLATALSAPSLNPAALLLTFMLFDTRMAAARLVMAILAVFLTTAVIDRLFRTQLKACPLDSEDAEKPTLKAFLRSWLQVAVRTVPLIIVGVVVSMIVALWLPVGILASTWGTVAAIVAVAAIAVPLAMPTFFEIPLALILISAGAPAGAAVAMLIAGPAINLPSLFTITRATNWKVAATVAGSIFALAIAGGLLVSVV
jgi:uncharacterized membrane protein YraQ (UPF0718 family)